MIPVPNLDDRTHREIVEEALRLIPQYCPEWTNFNPSDPGVTLVELFAWMTEMAIYRLNKVTDKNFIAFLSLMGVKLQSPQPARALLQFNLVPKSAPTWVTAGTPVSTQPTGKEEPVVFETQDDILVTDNQIIRCFTQISDEYADQTPFIDGRRPEGFEVFGGVNHVERSLYLGDPRFEQVGEDALLVIRVESAGHLRIVDLLEWEYWNGRRWRELTRSQTEVEEGAVAFEGIDAIEESELNGIKARWIRGRLVESSPSPEETMIETVVARVEVLGEGVPPVSATVNIDASVFLTVDLQRSFAPFGKEPRIENTFYLLPRSMPSLPGSIVRIDIRLADARQHDPPQPSEELSIVWEYWSGKKWKQLGQSTAEGSVSNEAFDFVDGTEALTRLRRGALPPPQGHGRDRGAGRRGPVAACPHRSGRLRPARPVRARRRALDLARRAPPAATMGQVGGLPLHRGRSAGWPCADLQRLRLPRPLADLANAPQGVPGLRAQRRGQPHAVPGVRQRFPQ
jgi:hypothetical protein